MERVVSHNAAFQVEGILYPGPGQCLLNFLILVSIFIEDHEEHRWLLLCLLLQLGNGSYEYGSTLWKTWSNHSCER